MRKSKDNEKKEIRTLTVRLSSDHFEERILAILKKSCHIRNMYIILHGVLGNFCVTLQKIFQNPYVMRAALFGRVGGKKRDDVTKILQGIESLDQCHQDMFSQLVTAAQDFDAKHVFKLLTALNGEFKGAATKKDKGEKAHTPRSRKIRDTHHMALPLDKERVRIKDDHFLITVGSHETFKFPMNFDNLSKICDLSRIYSYRLCYNHDNITLNITYQKDLVISNPMAETDEVHAAIDLGVNNLCSIFVLDEKTPSLVISGKDFKKYNHDFNRKKAVICSRKDQLANQLNEIENEFWQSLDEGEDPETNEEMIEAIVHWHNLQPKFQDYQKVIGRLYANRKAYFHTNFHKVARSILGHLQVNGVTTLVLSRNILSAKDKTNMGKVGNQRFVYMPFAIMVDALKLYGVEHGIQVIDSIDEAYTSKTNCLHGDVNQAQQSFNELNKRDPKVKILRATVFQGRRHKGAFYCHAKKKVYHSDLNGALNHLIVYFQSNEMAIKMRQMTFKLESPKVLKGAALFQWLDKPSMEAA